jgi:RNA polymerase sigma factor (sigma-70 family)
MILEMGGTEEDAKDIFNDGLLALMNSVDSADFKLTCKFSTLFCAICKNLWKTQLGKHKAARNYIVRKPEESSASDFTEKMDADLYKELFWDNFEKLSDVCKTILRCYFKEIPPKDIAQILGYTYGYLRKKKSHCNKYLVSLIMNHPLYLNINESIKTTVE